MANINDNYFNGLYKEMWRAFIPPELTDREIDFIISYFKPSPGAQVLDLMCGYGRHSLALARKGFSVTSVDNLQDYIDEIKDTARTESLSIDAHAGSILDFPLRGKYDLGICMGNSINFFNAADTLAILKKVAAVMNPGASLLINSWSLAEIVFKNFEARGWSRIGGVTFLNENQLLFHPTRVETESTMIAPDGTTEVKHAVDYIFSVNELDMLLNDAGFRLREIFSIPGKKKFALGEPRAYIIADVI